MSLDRIQSYRLELEQKLFKEKDLTIRHMYFLVKTTKPQELNVHNAIRNLWDNVFVEQRNILDRLCMQSIHFKVLNENKLFRDVSDDEHTLWHFYLTHHASDMSLNCQETLISYQQKINQHLKSIIDLCFLENLLHQPT